MLREGHEGSFDGFASWNPARVAIKETPLARKATGNPLESSFWKGGGGLPRSFRSTLEALLPGSKSLRHQEPWIKGGRGDLSRYRYTAILSYDSLFFRRGSLFIVLNLLNFRKIFSSSVK